MSFLVSDPGSSGSIKHVWGVFVVIAQVGFLAPDLADRWST